MVPQSSKRKLDVIIIFLIIFTFILNGYLSAQANEALILHQSKFQIESISCKGLSMIKKLLTNLDHNSRMRVVDYPNTFEVTHHSSIHEDTIVSVLSNAGYPTKKLNIQKRITIPFQKVKTKGNVVAQIHLPRRTCNATSATWKKFIRRLHYEWFAKSSS